MGSYVIDSTLFKNLFGTEEMRDVFSDSSVLQSWLDVEAALAQAEGDLGIISREIADEIVRKAKVEYLDLEELGRAIMKANHPIMPVVKQLQKACEGESGQFVHWGATTQDIMDTGTVLQIRNGLQILRRRLDELIPVLYRLTETYRNTLMAGRTHGQHALPTTFGYKTAVWLEEFIRHHERIVSLLDRVCVGNFFGAAGTLASLDDRGLEVNELMMKTLELGSTNVSWHTARDNYAEVLGFLSILCGTIGKIAREVVLLQSTEVAEISEPFKKGQVGSSTMPHKRNPMTSLTIIALSRIVRADAGLMTESMIHEHERDLAAWQVEWAVISEAFIMTDAAVSKMTDILGGLVVDSERMSENLNIAKGFLLSEKVMLKLGEKVGRQSAHDIVHHSTEIVNEEGILFIDALLRSEEVMAHFTEQELRELLDYGNYIGVVDEMINSALGDASAYIKK